VIRPRAPRLLDAEDARALSSLFIFAVLAVCAVLLLAFTLGLAVRVFEIAKGG
jgi:hypothetical protein